MYILLLNMSYLGNALHLHQLVYVAVNIHLAISLGMMDRDCREVTVKVNEKEPLCSLDV